MKIVEEDENAKEIDKLFQSADLDFLCYVTLTFILPLNLALSNV